LCATETLPGIRHPARETLPGTSHRETRPAIAPPVVPKGKPRPAKRRRAHPTGKLAQQSRRRPDPNGKTRPAAGKRQPITPQKLTITQSIISSRKSEEGSERGSDRMMKGVYGGPGSFARNDKIDPPGPQSIERKTQIAE
jgi:hypothetical protein